MLRLLDPPQFQGRLTSEGYFEGWYFKQVSLDRDYVLSLIPGISLKEGDHHAFIQVISTVDSESAYLRYPINQFSYTPGRFEVTIGKNRFSRDSVHLEDALITGDLCYGKPLWHRPVWYAPNVMGPYTYVPTMECNHAVLSLDHEVSGSVSYNDTRLSFDGGRGYQEKDWGTSFPSKWVWLQCNSFSSEKTSLFLSYARIPWRNSSFLGYIASVSLAGQVHHFTTYTRGRCVADRIESPSVSLTLENRSVQVSVRATAPEGSELIAPVKGSMERRIFESLSAEVSMQVTYRATGKVENLKGVCGGLEISGF